MEVAIVPQGKMPCGMQRIFYPKPFGLSAAEKVSGLSSSELEAEVTFEPLGCPRTQMFLNVLSLTVAHDLMLSDKIRITLHAGPCIHLPLPKLYY